MNQRERILAVLQPKEPDRVPLFEIWIDAPIPNLSSPISLDR
jgi:hypothetical protein